MHLKSYSLNPDNLVGFQESGWRNAFSPSPIQIQNEQFQVYKFRRENKMDQLTVLNEELTLSSLEVAEMIGKRHSDLFKGY